VLSEGRSARRAGATQPFPLDRRADVDARHHWGRSTFVWCPSSPSRPSFPVSTRGWWLTRASSVVRWRAAAAPDQCGGAAKLDSGTPSDATRARRHRGGDVHRLTVSLKATTSMPAGSKRWWRRWCFATNRRHVRRRGRASSPEQHAGGR